MPSAPRATYENLCDVRVAHEHFELADGRLCRRVGDGTLREVRYRLGGTLVAEVEGLRHSAAAIAWALHYGNWPMYPIHHADGNDENMEISNLLPLRHLVRPRCRITGPHGRYRQPLSGKVTYALPAHARTAWLRQVADMLREDWPYVLAQQAALRESYYAVHGKPDYKAWVPAEARTPRARRDPAKLKAPPTKRPRPIEGRKWHWYEGEWLSVPVAVHVSDDYRVRCHAVKHCGAVEFYYDPVAGRTKYLTAEQVLLLKGEKPPYTASMAAASTATWTI